MKPNSIVALASLALCLNLALRPVVVLGADAPALPDAAPEVVDQADKTGTNPLNFQRTLGLKNEFNGIGGRYANFTRLTYSEPLRANVKLGLELPLLATDLSGADKFGLSDITIKASWIPYATRKMGVALGTDLILPTATDDFLGSEKWQIAPNLTVAFFLPHSVIFAPAYKHGISFAGESSRADINTGTVDFYLVWKFAKGRQWLTFDPTLLFDYENDRYESATIRLTYGRVLGKIGDAVVSGFIKPGVGIGRDRLNDWSLEVGMSLIGF